MKNFYDVLPPVIAFAMQCVQTTICHLARGVILALFGFAEGMHYGWNLMVAHM